MIEWISTSKQPKSFLIREEVHPLKAHTSIFRVFHENMEPLYIGRETLQEAEAALRETEPVRSVTVIYREEEQPSFEGYRVYQSCGYFYPQRQLGDTWLYFPADGPLLIEEMGFAKCFRKRGNAVKFLERYIASEQAAMNAGLFDGIPSLGAGERLGSS